MNSLSRKTVIVTGGAGFIGSNLVRHIINDTDCKVVVLDCLSYAGNLQSLVDLNDNPRLSVEVVNILNITLVSQILFRYKPSAVLHLAAESHVDRSIDSPGEFIQTNIVGTYNLLQASIDYWHNTGKPTDFRFLHVSTDEVFGSLSATDAPFSEKTPYDPHSPYSASKAASDHLVRAWHDTYGLPVLITNCSNNYGPFQFPEKLIPVVILKCLKGEKIPVYGKGENIRDWLYVEDHCKALVTVLEKGNLGDTYLIGGNNELRNIDLVRSLCSLMDEFLPAHNGQQYEHLIHFVKDRPGHDLRYAINASKIRQELGWKPVETRLSGLRKTVQWYLNNTHWWQSILSGKYKLERIGIGR